MTQDPRSNKRKWYVLRYADGRMEVVHGWPAVVEARRRCEAPLTFHGYHTLEKALGEVKNARLRENAGAKAASGKRGGRRR